MTDTDAKFHAYDGFCFRRSEGGWVEFYMDMGNGKEEVLASFDPATWASIVSFVSIRNTNDDAYLGRYYREALAFHQERGGGHNRAKPTTGSFPAGKLTKSDEGSIQFALGEKDGKVVLDFGTPVAWIGMRPQEAADIGAALIKWACEVGRKNGDMIHVTIGG